MFRPFFALAHAALAFAVTAADLVGLVVRFAVGDHVVAVDLVYLAFALLPVKFRIAGTQAALRDASIHALRGVQSISLLHKQFVRPDP